MITLILAALIPMGASALTCTHLGPTNGSTSVCADTVLRITFDAPPTLGTNGWIRIYREDNMLVSALDLGRNSTLGTQPRIIGGQTYQAYPVRIAGNTATIFPTNSLNYNQTYHVTVDPAVFPGFEGIGSTRAWRFTTKSSAPAAASNYLVVAADGTGDFCTVQGAVDFVPDHNTNRVYVNLRNGIYTELVRVRAKHNLVFRGQNRERTLITYPNNDRINPGAASRTLFDIQAQDIQLDRLTLSNSTPIGGSQAEALRVRGARCQVHDCNLLSYQDTLLVNSPGDSAYVSHSRVAGSVDFVWGSGTVVFQDCEIQSLSNGYLCQMRNPAGQHGAVFLDCRLTDVPGVTRTWLARINPNVYPHSAVTFVACSMPPSIASSGWLLSAAGPTQALQFAEYQTTDSQGAPGTNGARAPFSKQLDPAQAARFRDLPHVLGGWMPQVPAPAFPDAQGAGARALGGRGGDVSFVTTLADSGPGSLREAIRTAPPSGRTVLFKVSGIIELNSPLTLNKPRLTLAGQSAPAGLKTKAGTPRTI